MLPAIRRSSKTQTWSMLQAGEVEAFSFYRPIKKKKSPWTVKKLDLSGHYEAG